MSTETDDGSFEVCVKLRCGHTTRVNVEPTTWGSQLMNAVWMSTVDSEFFLEAHNGRKLDFDTHLTMAELDLKDGDTLTMMPPPSAPCDPARCSGRHRWGLRRKAEKQKEAKKGYFGEWRSNSWAGCH